MPLLSIGPTTDQLRDASALISGHFRTDVRVVDLFRGAGGANNGSHVVAADVRGRFWGIKLVTRGVPGGNGTEKEFLASQLAVALGLTVPPGTLLCDNGLPTSSLNGPVALIPWLPQAKALGDLTPDEISEVHKNAYAFARQFGQWIAFGLLFSVRDRSNLGNWIWAKGTQTLGMIDTEESLGSDASFPNDYQLLVNQLLTPAPNHPGLVAAVSDGIRATFSRYHECEGAVQHILAHSVAAGFSSPYSASDPEQVIHDWVTQSGL